jgi:hypothetical protein
VRQREGAVDRRRALERRERRVIARRPNERTALIQRGDMEGRRRLVRDFLRANGGAVVNPRADSAAAAKECGEIPALSDAGRRAARNDTLLQRARALESEAGQAGVKASGLAEAKFFVTRERLYYWMKSSSAITWGDAERGLLERRRADLERVRRGIMGAEVAGG